MSHNEKNNDNKDITNSLSKYSDYNAKGTNFTLDSAKKINDWYAEQLNKIIQNKDIPNRIETNVDNTILENDDSENSNIENIKTKVESYNQIQTNSKILKSEIINNEKIKTKTIVADNENLNIQENKIKTKISNKEKFLNKQIKISKKISTGIKGAKIINKTANNMIKTGKNINAGLNDNSLKSFEKSATKLAEKPIKKITNNISRKISKTVSKKSIDLIVRITKLLVKLMSNMMKMLISILPSIAPVIIILIVIVCFCSYFGLDMDENTKKSYEDYMINTQKEYDAITLEYYNQGKIVDGTIEGKGMINWKAALSIIQMLNGKLSYDYSEKELLKAFKEAELYEKIEDATYSYEKETEKIDENGNVSKNKETVTETKKIVTNSSLQGYIDWCNSNFDIINNYKKNKEVSYDFNQKSFKDDEIEQIKMLYNSTSFFDLFSEEFKNTYAYEYVSINDEKLQAIYNEFLRNAGKRYLMDHSNLKYDECMEYYDCSSWVIHCLAHTGIVTIANTGASGIYDNYCYPISVEERQAGDLIFLKDTYDTGKPGSISHIGIYMGKLTINGETDEWIIDTGGNPSGVRIRKYMNGWWNGSNFYGFGRLKQ